MKLKTVIALFAIFTLLTTACGDDDSDGVTDVVTDDDGDDMAEDGDDMADEPHMDDTVDIAGILAADLDNCRSRRAEWRPDQGWHGYGLQSMLSDSSIFLAPSSCLSWLTSQTAQAVSTAVPWKSELQKSAQTPL